VPDRHARSHLTALLAAVVIPAAASADTIVQGGSLTGESGTHEIVLEQFDPTGGLLNFVQLDAVTATIGGGTAPGTGVPVHVLAELNVDYFLGEELLVSTSAVIDFVVPNNSPGSFTLFDNDTEQAVIDDPAGLEPWIGSGEIVLTAVAEFTVTEDPPGIVDFGAGGSVSYTVTYDYDQAPPPTGDVTGDGVVNVDDLVEVILAWGACPVPPGPCPADVDGDGLVDVDDLVLVILNWTA
jgi:hypothetical protein